VFLTVFSQRWEPGEAGYQDLAFSSLHLCTTEAIRGVKERLETNSESVF
jgi:hypothetical protein